MINVRDLEIVLSEQAEEIARKAQKKFCSRLEEKLIDLDSPQAQVVIGVRRCGKSTLCLTALRSANVKFAYVNFDDERLAMLNADDLNSMLEVLYKIYGSFTHLFLDEAQNVPGWHLFVNRLLRKDMHVVITGSNAKLLSGELATHLTGRHHVIKLFPFSFAEYCNCIGVETDGLTTDKIASRRRAFDEYLQQGGFPELLHIKDKRAYITDLTDNILKRDIEERFKIRHKAEFERLAQHLMNVAPTALQYANLAQELSIGSDHTAQNYIKYLNEAFLLLGLHKYSFKSKQRLIGEKAYCIDVALMDKRPDAFSGSNFGWRLETIVYLELLRRCISGGNDLYYLSENRSECDFVVCQGNKVIKAFQVSYDVSDTKTRNREIKGLLMIANKTNCTDLTILTDHEYNDIEVNNLTIKIRPIYEWTLINQ
ncbi:MAG: ATP-binding protein [Bacteroides sp.]|nr:ATP-binding protein [Bacteroides sp.]MCM1379159.1 ATP-binding protein [Bacteroides sp.]MCM1445192.1 ATP-binding protein [Prevotella sp.]